MMEPEPTERAFVDGITELWAHLPADLAAELDINDFDPVRGSTWYGPRLRGLRNAATWLRFLVPGWDGVEVAFLEPDAQVTYARYRNRAVDIYPFPKSAEAAQADGVEFLPD